MRPILVANWKNHPSSSAEATKLLVAMARQRDLYKKLSVFVAPPLSFIETASKKIKRFAQLASQDIFFASEGTYTGVVTADILKSFGVRLVIVGHSERRALGETDKVVAEKIKTALKAGITPLLCVGEEIHDAEGNYFEFLSAQLRTSLESIKRNDATRLMVAYEPVWAIGKKGKDAISPSELAQVIIFIKKVLSEIFGREAALKIPVLYGGSVEPINARELITQTGARGVLVGRASLENKSFSAIAKALTSK